MIPIWPYLEAAVHVGLLRSTSCFVAWVEKVWLDVRSHFVGSRCTCLNHARRHLNKKCEVDLPDRHQESRYRQVVFRKFRSLDEKEIKLIVEVIDDIDAKAKVPELDLDPEPRMMRYESIRGGGMGWPPLMGLSRVPSPESSNLAASSMENACSISDFFSNTSLKNGV